MDKIRIIEKRLRNSCSDTSKVAFIDLYHFQRRRTILSIFKLNENLHTAKFQAPTPDKHNPKFNLPSEINPARKPCQQSRSSGHGRKMRRLTTFLMTEGG